MITKEMLAETLLAFEHDAHDSSDGCAECAMALAADTSPELARALQICMKLASFDALVHRRNVADDIMMAACKMGLILGRRLGLSEAMEALR